MKFCVFDIEDNSPDLMAMEKKKSFDKRKPVWDSVVIQIAALDENGGEYYFDDNVEKFLDFVRMSEFTHFYAHNVQYDLGFIFRNRLDLLDCVFVGGRIIRATWKGKTFLDSYNLFPMPLKQLAPAVGLEKPDDPDFKSKEYVFNDCEIVRRALNQVRDLANDYGVVKLPATIGGLAMRIFQNRWGEIQFDDTACFPDRAPYMYGGRVELFQERATDVFYADVNSLYPWAMTQSFPAPLKKCKQIKDFGVVHATVEVKMRDLAPLPFRREDDSILFPCGKFTGWWTVLELRRALENGARLLKVHESFGTDRHSAPYAEFVEHFYQARLESKNKAYNLFYKLLQNNLYGQLAVKGEITRWLWSSELKNQKILTKYKIPQQKSVNLVHAAYVTSWGRLRLLQFMERLDSKQLVYCDTDSIIFSGKNPFQFSKKLGDLKLETEIDGKKASPSGRWPFCATSAPKCYQVGDVWKAKGVRKSNAKKFMTQGFVYEERPFRMREACTFYYDDLEKKTPRASVWRFLKIEKKTHYDKKKLLPSGKYVPLVLAEK